MLHLQNKSIAMDLEYKILDHLSIKDNGKLVDITFLDDDYENLESALNKLKGRNLVVLEIFKVRNFEAFGISSQRPRSIKAKINNNGRIYLDALKSNLESSQKNKKRKSWKFAYLFNF